MAQQLEIEYKTLLNQADYQKVFEYYQLQDQSFQQQTNYYFDTSDQQLQKKRWGLRIRQYQNYGELTLKCPTTTIGLLEITDSLSLQETKQLIEEKRIKLGGEVAKRLTENGIDPQEVRIIAELTTKRYEFPIAVGLLALDHSWYNGREDYELELEVSDETQGKIDFSQLLEMLKIPYQKAENKILRAMNR
ncbi:CYTH domain-containing protein [Enterococcus aquimarinus]|nr:CYTH domain-containing protein [Enterococcus aquimarinus]